MKTINLSYMPEFYYVKLEHASDKNEVKKNKRFINNNKNNYFSRFNSVQFPLSTQSPLFKKNPHQL